MRIWPRDPLARLLILVGLVVAAVFVLPLFFEERVEQNPLTEILGSGPGASDFIVEKRRELRRVQAELAELRAQEPRNELIQRRIQSLEWKELSAAQWLDRALRRRLGELQRLLLEDQDDENVRAEIRSTTAEIEALTRFLEDEAERTPGGPGTD